MCRLSMPQPIALETGPVELDVPSGAPYSTVSDVPATVAHAAIPVDDPRLVVYRVKRPLNNPWSLSSDQELVTAAWERAQTGTPLPDASIAPPLPNALRDQFAQYSARDENRRNAELLLAAFIRYNTSITDYNPVLSALLASNTAIYMMGTMEQAKSALMYLIKYVTKDAFSLSASLVVLLAAARYCSTHPSRAADAGTEQRGLLYLFQRMVNAIVGSSETSICQALAHILEYPAHFTSDRFIVVFVDAAVAFAREGWMQERGRSPEDAWARVNAPTFAYDSDDRELLGESDDDSVASARPATAGVARQAVPPSAATASASDSDSDSDDASTRSARPPAPDMGLDEERDLAHAASAAAANEESGFGTAPVYRLQDDGSIVPVPQHLNYSLRGEALRAVALVEYACIIEVVRCGDDDDGGIESGGSVAASGRHRAGRRPNTVFRFDARHPLAETHVQRLRSQQRTPIFAGSGVPAYPGPPPSDPSARWLTRARRFATYILTAYEPWDTATGLPTFDLEHPWDDFIAFMARSLASSDFIIVNRALTIRGLARSLRINKQRADAAAAFRNCAARRWRHPVPVDPLDDLTRALRATGFAVDDHDYDERGEREEQRQLNLQALDEVMRALAGAEAPTDRALAHLQRERDFIERTLAMFQQCWGPAPAPQAAGAAIPASALSLAAQAPLDDDGNERALHDIASAVRRYDAPPDAPPQAHASVDAHAPAPVAGAGLQLGPANVELQRLTALPADAGRPNDDQRAALHIVAEDNLDQRLRAASGSGAPPSQLLLLVHGGPGVGKSFFAQKVRQLCRAAGVDFVFCAPTGIAAANVRGGVTFNRLFKLPVKSTTLKRLQVMENNRLRALLQSCGVLFIDEISMAKAHEIAFIDERIRTALGSRVAFGGVNVIFGGDMMQLPPVGGKCMYELVALDNARDAATRVGADLFAKARLVRLTQQMRASSDLVHSGLIQRMRDAADLQLVLSELRPYLLGHVLTPERVAAEPQWRFATVATLGNPERHAINQAQAKAWALMHNQPYVTWQQQVRIAGVDPLSTGSADGMARFVELNPALVQVWTDGAPGICTDNVQPSVGISNGTRFTQRSLWLADPAQMRDLEQALSEARGFCEIRLPAGVVPGVVTVDLAVDDVDEWDDNIIVSKRLRDASAADDRRGFVTVPLEADMYPSEEDVVLPGSLKKKSVRLFGPPVELFFAATVNKVQGQTLDRLLLSLVIRGHGDMRRPTFKSLLVLLTRVRHGDHFACTPLPPGETLDWVIGSQARPAAGPVVEGL